MDSFFDKLEVITNSNSPLNFGRRYDRKELEQHFRDNVKWSWAQHHKSDLVAVVTLTKENELGFVINLDYARMGSLYVFRVVRAIKEIYFDPPVWCKVQEDNVVINKALHKLGFQVTEINHSEGVNYVVWSQRA